MGIRENAYLTPSYYDGDVVKPQSIEVNWGLIWTCTCGYVNRDPIVMCSKCLRWKGEEATFPYSSQRIGGPRLPVRKTKKRW